MIFIYFHGISSISVVLQLVLLLETAHCRAFGLELGHGRSMNECWRGWRPQIDILKPLVLRLIMC